MKKPSYYSKTLALFCFITISLTSCLTTKRLDKFVAKQYNNEIPAYNKSKESAVTIKANIADPVSGISFTQHEGKKFLPLLFYWESQYAKACRLNSQIFANTFAGNLQAQYGSQIAQKLGGQKIELTIENVPRGFNFEIREYFIFFIVGYYTAERVGIDAEPSDLVVSYRTIGNGTTVKTGRIIVKNTISTRPVRFFQTWKSAAAEFIKDYNSEIPIMTKSFAKSLLQEL